MLFLLVRQWKTQAAHIHYQFTGEGRGVAQTISAIAVTDTGAHDVVEDPDGTKVIMPVGIPSPKCKHIVAVVDVNRHGSRGDGELCRDQVERGFSQTSAHMSIGRQPQ